MGPLSQSCHRRLNALTGEWILVSPHRNQRPWQGQVESTPQSNEPAYDPSCYLCAGNTRVGGNKNPAYSSTFVFDNDYPAITPESEAVELNKENILFSKAERGICRVGCFSPRHDLTFSRMSIPEIVAVIEMWREQFGDLAARDFIHYVQIFENRGAMMGASNPHPHCQIWGTSSLPNEPRKEQSSMQEYLHSHHKCLLCEYLRIEKASGERVIYENDIFMVLVPYWAVWPFETLIVPRQHVADISQTPASDDALLAEAIKKITSCYDDLFNVPFPYSMGFHQQPTDGQPHPEWHMHAHFFPPLLRSAGIRKFMVGFELLGSPQRDITPESAADRLRKVCKSTL